MASSESEFELSTSVFVILRDLIHERLGVYFDAGKRTILADKLAPQVGLRGLRTFLDYYYLLKYGPGAEQEWPFVADALSVPETYFWREVGQIQTLVNRLVPQFAEKFPGRTLSIWSAACATGEEPLTIAMALQEAGWFDRLSIRIFASDASVAALEKARRGVYRERSFRVLPQALLDKYFTEVPGGRRIDSYVHSRVEFGQANLMTPDDVAPYAASAVIFCRNVFIYFSDEAIASTVRRFAQSMQQPGYLFTGAAESLLKVTDDFELHEVDGSFVYALRNNH